MLRTALQHRVSICAYMLLNLRRVLRTGSKTKSHTISAAKFNDNDEPGDVEAQSNIDENEDEDEEQDKYESRSFHCMHG